MLIDLIENDVAIFLVILNNPMIIVFLIDAKLIIQLYIQQVWSFLMNIVIKIYNRVFDKIEIIKEFRFRLNDAAFDELRDLNHTFVIQTLNFEFIFNQARSINKDINKNSIFNNKYFVDRSWRSRL